ncbi:MAG: hypothetical protein AAFR66_03135 [Bacteroidota bacterium]
MNVVQFIRLFLRHFWLMATVGLIMASLVFYLTKDGKKSYSSFTILNTGLVSGYSIEKSSNSRVDYAYVSSEFDNLINLAKSVETLEELSLNLMAECLLLSKPDNKIMSAEGFPTLLEKFEVIPEVELRPMTDKASVIEYLQNAKQNLNHPVYELFYSDDDYFGIDHLTSQITVVREGKSDMLKFSYQSSDPAICKRTLELLIEIFISKQKTLKEGQSASVVEFFERATQKSANKLRDEELKMKAFRENYRIINYYEQTRFIAGKREDLYEKYNGEMMKKAASKASLQRLEEKLEERVNLSGIHKELAEKRNELSDIQSQLIQIELAKDYHDTFVDPLIEKVLKSKRERVKLELEENASKTFEVVMTPEGAELKNMISSWLENYLALEEANARIEVMDNRKREFEILYDNFAPLGSKLKKIERAIDVAEREYLENLHSLNQARLHQHNLMMSTNLVVVDKPLFAPKPAKSQRMILVIVSFMAGFILVFGAAVAMDYMDESMRNPAIAMRNTGLSLAGMFPDFPEDSKKSKVLFDEIELLTSGLLIQNIQAETHAATEAGKPTFISLLSIREGEGKTFLAKQIQRRFRQLGNDVLIIRPKNEGYFYHNDWTFVDPDTDQEYSLDCTAQFQQYSFVLIEYPGILKSQYPNELLAKSALNLLVCDANRVWREVDKKALQTFQKGTQKKPALVLNRTRVDDLEDFIGEVPKHRSLIRRKLKRIISKE